MDEAAALALVTGLKAIGAGLAMVGAIGAGAGIGILVAGAVQGIAHKNLQGCFWQLHPRLQGCAKPHLAF